MRKLPPVTPGEILLEEFLKPMGISQYRLAKEIAVPAQRIGEIVAGRRAVTADTDLRLCRFFGLSNGFVKVDGPDGKEIVRVKTLQLNFKRIGDDDNLKGEQVKFMGYKWIYATTPEALALPTASK